MRRPRSERMPVGAPGIWHLVSRCVRRAPLLQGPGRREWLADRFAAWFDVLAVDCLAYALMSNHIHLVVRTRPDVAARWSDAEVTRRFLALRSVEDGAPGMVPPAQIRDAGMGVQALRDARKTLAHPGVMMRAMKEGFARWVNQQEHAAGHVWESRYQDVAVIDAGGAFACIVYVDLNPFRAGLVQDPAKSTFCSAAHRLGVQSQAADRALGERLHVLSGHPILDSKGRPDGSWEWTAADIAAVTTATARLIRTGKGALPAGMDELLPRLGISRDKWAEAQGRGGIMSGNVIGSHQARRKLAGAGRLASDKTGLFGEGLI